MHKSFMNTETYKISHYDYTIPKHLIAQHPTAKRDESRLLILHRKSARIEHRKFYDIIEYLNCGDVLVLNDTKVEKYFRDNEPDVVGLSAIVSTSYMQVKRLARIIKKVNKKTLIVCGGNLAASANTILRKTQDFF